MAIFVCAIGGERQPQPGQLGTRHNHANEYTDRCQDMLSQPGGVYILASYRNGKASQKWQAKTQGFGREGLVFKLDKTPDTRLVWGLPHPFSSCLGLLVIIPPQRNRLLPLLHYHVNIGSGFGQTYLSFFLFDCGLVGGTGVRSWPEG